MLKKSCAIFLLLLCSSSQVIAALPAEAAKKEAPRKAKTRKRRAKREDIRAQRAKKDDASEHKPDEKVMRDPRGACQEFLNTVVALGMMVFVAGCRFGFIPCGLWPDMEVCS